MIPSHPDPKVIAEGPEVRRAIKMVLGTILSRLARCSKVSSASLGMGFDADSLQREGAAEAKFLPTSIIYKIISKYY